MNLQDLQQENGILLMIKVIDNMAEEMKILYNNNTEDTNVAFKNYAPFRRCVEAAENLDIIMPLYNLTDYSDNYADSSGSFYQFKRDESPIDDAEV